MRPGPMLACLLALAPVAGGAGPVPAGADPALVEAGRYLATAGDCAACHGTALSGGDPIASPIGRIYASNITPDPETGIGGWSLAEFADLMRKGEAPDGHIYPAMPYTAYTGLSDRDIAALYSYLMLGVEPVAKEAPETRLPFPFVRPAMIAWNALFLHEGHPRGAVPVAGAEAQRGQYLVEVLGHCSACHSPRGQLMQPLAGHHLGGAVIDGWWAPDITPGPGGIGGWDDARLTEFLTTGHAGDAVAAGEMAKVVSLSLSRLTAEDMGAIVAYLRAVPPVASTKQSRRIDAMPGDPVAAQEAGAPAGGAVDPEGWSSLLASDSVDGAVLYQSACASCHGIDGRGPAGGAFPSLRETGGVTAPEGTTLVEVIAYGVDRQVGERHALMPGFRASLDDAQIAAVANYVRTGFGGVEGGIDEGRVAAILDGKIDTPWLIRDAHWLSLAGLAVGALVLAGLAAWGWRALSRRGPRTA